MTLFDAFTFAMLGCGLLAILQDIQGSLGTAVPTVLLALLASALAAGHIWLVERAGAWLGERTPTFTARVGPLTIRCGKQGDSAHAA